MSKPTPTPWEAKDYMVSNYPSEPFTVICYTANNAKSRTPENLANAAFIVRAVNSHDELVAACETMLAAFKHVPLPEEGSLEAEVLLSARSQIRAALTKARG